jgi:hypothetical protein
MQTAGNKSWTLSKRSAACFGTIGPSFAGLLRFEKALIGAGWSGTDRLLTQTRIEGLALTVGEFLQRLFRIGRGVGGTAHGRLQRACG